MFIFHRKSNHSATATDNNSIKNASGITTVPVRAKYLIDFSEFISYKAIYFHFRKVRALRLFDTPATPKTLIKKSSFDSGPPTPVQSKLIRKSILSNVAFGGNGIPPRTPNIADRPKALPVHNKVLDPVTANINPFSPSSM